MLPLLPVCMLMPVCAAAAHCAVSNTAVRIRFSCLCTCCCCCVAHPTAPPAVNLLSIAGCSSAVSNYLPAGLDGSCEVQVS
jgi:hypothetical protein